MSRPGTPSRAGSDRGTDGDRGSASVLLLAVAGVGVVVALSVAVLGQAVLARHTAAAAADLAALAAAQRWPAPDCDRARVVAVAHGAQLRRCTVGDGGAVVVEVWIEVAGDGVWGRATGLARAGPVLSAARDAARPLVPSIPGGGRSDD